MKILDTKLKERVLALSGVFQAATLVKQLGRKGKAEEQFFNACIESLFKIEAKDTLDVYGGIQNLKLGLEVLIDLFSHSKGVKDAEIARYVLSLLHLERKLFKDAVMQQKIQTGIRRAETQAMHFGCLHDNVMANLSSIYVDTLSTFKFRIFVSGEPLYLNQASIMNKIRGILFSGIRSAVLWQQLGGRRWQLLISRRSILSAAQALLKEATSNLPQFERN